MTARASHFLLAACVVLGCEGTSVLGTGDDPRDGTGQSGGSTGSGGTGALDARALNDGAREANAGGAGGDAATTDGDASDSGAASGGADGDAGRFDARPDAPICEPGGTLLSEQRFNTVIASYPKVAMADLNADGKLDMAIADANADKVTIRLGNGDGTFQTTHVYATGPWPNGIAIGDVDGDGKPDIATSDAGYFDGTKNSLMKSGISVLLGLGGGAFAPHVDYGRTASSVAGTKLQTIGVAIGDVNGDGIADVAAGGDAPYVAVYYGTGGGALSPDVEYDSGMVAPFSVAIGDLNADGHADLVTGGLKVWTDGGPSTGEVSVLLGNGSSFAAPVVYPSGGQHAYTTVIALIDGDSIPDLAVATWLGSGVSVFRGRGDGTFDPHTEFAGCGYAYDVRVGDMNRDSTPDLIVGNAYGVTVLVQSSPMTFDSLLVKQMLGVGQGVTYDTYDTNASSGEPTGVLSTAVGDLDGDGAADLALGVGEYDVLVLKNQGDGHLALSSPSPHHHAPESIVSADLDGDGTLDVAVTNIGSRDVGVILGNGNGTFQPEVDYPLNAPGTPLVSSVYPTDLAVADLTSDGKPDLIAVANGPNPGALMFFINQGNGVFQRSANTIPGAFGKPVASDLNGDGATDLIVPGSFATAADGGSTASDTFGVAIGNGDGTFRPAVQYSSFAGASIQDLATGDFDSDGKLDVVAVSSAFIAGSADHANILLGNGNGTLSPAVHYPLDAGDASDPYGYSMKVAVGDLDGDSKLDVVAGRSFYGSVTAVLGKGDGTFGASLDSQLVAPIPNYSMLILGFGLGDFDGNGKLDVAALRGGVNLRDTVVSVMLSNGDGTFAAPTDRLTGAISQGMTIGDFTNAGRPQIVTTNFASNDLSFLPTVATCTP